MFTTIVLLYFICGKHAAGASDNFEAMHFPLMPGLNQRNALLLVWCIAQLTLGPCCTHYIANTDAMPLLHLKEMWEGRLGRYRRDVGESGASF